MLPGREKPNTRRAPALNNTNRHPLSALLRNPRRIKFHPRKTRERLSSRRHHRAVRLQERRVRVNRLDSRQRRCRCRRLTFQHSGGPCAALGLVLVDADWEKCDGGVGDDDGYVAGLVVVGADLAGHEAGLAVGGAAVDDFGDDDDDGVLVCC